MSKLIEAMDCVGCGEAGRYSVLLAVGPDNLTDQVRYYLPNQNAREVQGTDLDPVEQVVFCQRCMRVVEDGLRQVISDLQSENDVGPSKIDRQ